MPMRAGARPGSRLHGMSQEGLVPAVIQKAVVTAVDPDAYTMSVSTLVGKRHFEFMPIPSVYAHPFSAEGVHVMPDVGAELWIVVPSDGGSRAFPLSYQPPVNDLASMAGGRPRLTPGDIVLQGREGNAVRVRRGGVVEIESSPTCRILFLPREGKIVSIAEATSLFTLGGSVEWYAGERDELPTGDRIANFRARLKASVVHKWSMVDIDVGGELDSGGPVTIRTYASGDVEKESDRELVSQIVMRSRGIDVSLAEDKELRVGSVGGNAHEPVILGRTFLEKLDDALNEVLNELRAIQTGISGAGGSYTPTLPVVSKIAALRTAIGQSLSDDAPLLSSFTRTE